MSTTRHPNWTPKSFRSIEELKADLDAIEQAHAAGRLTTTGNWSAGQILEHCSIIMRSSFDGFEAKAPLPIRIVGSLFFKPRLSNPKAQMKPGFQLPKKASSVLPREQVSVEEGLSQMREQLARLDRGERMTQDSPVLGKMTHEQWIAMHLNHCRMHCGFIDCGQGS